MDASYLSVLCVPGDHGGPPLAFAGDRAGEKLLNGKLLLEGRQVGEVVDGIASFVEKPVDWPPEEIERLRTAGQIERNWQNEIWHAGNTPTRGAFCDELAAVDGIILELAAGPGGGSMPPMLNRNPSARVVVNDVSLAILQLWGEFLRKREVGPQLCLAAFNATSIPIRSGAVAAVSGSLALSSIGGLSIFAETRRVLGRGGAVYSQEMIVDSADWARMPEERRLYWEQAMPGLTKGAARLLEQAGLEVESCEILPGRELDPDEGGLPRDAADHGVTLRIVWEYVKARKR
jgi:hypothetical protein